jgi:archaellum component FlaD/FlaE
MVDAPENKNMLLSNHELEKELTTLVSKAVIPSFIADKIKEKLKNENVQLTLIQLYELVDIIQKKVNIQQYPAQGPPTPQQTGQTQEGSLPEGEWDEDEDMEKLFHTIEGLSSRINKIEERRIKEYGEPAGRIITTDDIEIPDKYADQKHKISVHPLNWVSSDPNSVVVLMKWLQFLIDKVGKQNLVDVLDYYVDVGWISEKIISNLIDYSEGITDDSKIGEKKKLTDLNAKDHIQSLLFIQRLKGEKQDKYFVERIERQLTKMTKNLEKTPD